MAAASEKGGGWAIFFSEVAVCPGDVPECQCREGKGHGPTLSKNPMSFYPTSGFDSSYILLCCFLTPSPYLN